MSRNKLIILADKLDRNGHTKKPLWSMRYLKEVLTNKLEVIKSVLDMVLELTAELQQAVKTGVAGPMERVQIYAKEVLEEACLMMDLSLIGMKIS